MPHLLVTSFFSSVALIGEICSWFVCFKINIDDNCLNCLSQSIFFSPLTAF